MDNTIRTITIHAKEIRKDKQVFIACSAEINKKWYKIKFTQDCVNPPRKKGLYELTIDFDKCSLEKGKHYTNSAGTTGISNDVIWVRHIVGIRAYTEDELKALNRMAFSGVFGD